jgi:hypothetical protein
MGTPVLFLPCCRLLGGTNICIDCRKSSVCFHIIQPDPFHADWGFSVTEIQESSRRAHRAKRAGRDHIDFLESALLAEFCNNTGHLFGRNDTGISIMNPLVDLIDRLAHALKYHFMNIYIILYYLQ